MKVVKIITYIPATAIMLVVVIFAVLITFAIVFLEAIQKALLKVVEKVCDFYNFDKDKYTKVVSWE